MFEFLHFLVLFLDDQAVGQFRRFFLRQMLWNLHLFPVAAILARCGGIYVIPLRRGSGVSLLIVIVVAVSMFLLEVFGFFVREFGRVGGGA